MEFVTPINNSLLIICYDSCCHVSIETEDRIQVKKCLLPFWDLPITIKVLGMKKNTLAHMCNA